MLGATSLEASGIGDIWSTGAFSFESPLKDLLDSNEYTLEQLLDEDELLQELRGCHEKLQEFFSSESAVTKLIKYVITKRPDSSDKSIRYPYMACEIVCCEIDPILDAIVNGQAKLDIQESDSIVEVQQTSILDLLFSVLDEPIGALDDYRAGYLDKILMVTFRKKGQQMMEYINTHSDLLPKLLNHLYSHSIMQIAQRLLLPRHPMPVMPESNAGDEIISGDDDEEEQLICDWIHHPDVLNILLSYISERNETEQTLDLSLHASEVLITIIQNSFLHSDIILEITKPENLRRIMDAATVTTNNEFSRHESLLTSAMNVLESLILQLGGFGAVVTVPENTPEGEVPEEPYLPDLTNLVAILPELLDRLSALLLHESTSEWKTATQFSESEQMLGTSRLRIVRVLESLVLLGDSAVDSKLVQSDCLVICLDFFWKFQWCSMLHQSVANLLVHVIDGQNARYEMQEFFINKCNLLGRLMDSFEKVNVVENIETVTTSEGWSGSDGPLPEDDAADAPLPVSEDDIDAALETPEMQNAEDANLDSPEMTSTGAVRYESRGGSTAGDTSLQLPSQTFRYGYMGHVLIICQALVHAYTSEQMEDTGEGSIEIAESTDEKMEDCEVLGESKTESVPAKKEGEDTAPLSEEEAEQDVPRDDFGEPLLLFELLYSHPLAAKWHEFVDTTLDAEIAIQSTQLGGYDLQPGLDPMQPHRPGLADDDYMLGDDGGGPPVPPRGMLGGGDAIDMDDNDLEVAASMMIGLQLARPGSPDEDEDSGSSGNSERSYNSGETASERSAYAFDDPLGKTGGLGIELGKLTQYRPGESKASEEDNDDESSHSSSDEEPEMRSSDEDVPVMDLFAGNFNIDEPEAPQDAFADFANFDAAPTDENDDIDGDDFGPFADASSSKKPDEDKPSVDDIFGEGDHAELLELDEDDILADTFAGPDTEAAEILEPEDTAAALVEPNNAVGEPKESLDSDAPEVVELSDAVEKTAEGNADDIVKVEVGTNHPENIKTAEPLELTVDAGDNDDEAPVLTVEPSDAALDDLKAEKSDTAPPLTPENGGSS